MCNRGWHCTIVSFPWIFLILSPSVSIWLIWRKRNKIPKMFSLYICVFHWLKKHICLWIHVFPIGFDISSISIKLVFHRKQTSSRCIHYGGVCSFNFLKGWGFFFQQNFVLKIKNKSSPYYQFSSVQLLSCVDSLRPHGVQHARFLALG